MRARSSRSCPPGCRQLLTRGNGATYNHKAARRHILYIMTRTIEPVPGDVTTEPVSTHQQSHVDGRVGPPTIAQDAAADYFVPEGVEQVKPGDVLPAAYPWAGRPLPTEATPSEYSNEVLDVPRVEGGNPDESQSNGPVTSKRDSGSK